MSLTSAQLVQYVVVRGDLLRLLSWPTGAVIAQACHASTAVLWAHRNDPNTIEYTSELDHMHKVVLEVSTNHRVWGWEAELRCTCMNVMSKQKLRPLWFSYSKSDEHYFRISTRQFTFVQFF